MHVRPFIEACKPYYPATGAVSELNTATISIPANKFWQDGSFRRGTARMDPVVVDASIDQIAQAIFDRWTRGPVIEFAEAIHDALFLHVANKFVLMWMQNAL